MEKCDKSPFVISACGVTSAIGQGKKAFCEQIFNGNSAFGVLERPGRQGKNSFLGAEIKSLDYSDFSKRFLRTASFSSKAALVTLREAWEEANLDECDPNSIGLIVGGSNIQQRELTETHKKYFGKTEFLRPTYGFSFMDSDLCGLCTEYFGIKGFAFTVGGASASGQVAIIQAISTILSEQADTVIVIGALNDISHWECQALRSMGAMGSSKYFNSPQKSCRPFDQGRDGFIYGESCGVVIIERLTTAKKRKVSPYSILRGWSMGVDANRNPNPSYEGEVKVIKKALKMSSLQPTSIDYVNPHGTGSIIGDEIELKALKACSMNKAYINTTKSIIGHGLSSAGTVEIIATLLQMKFSKLHPSLNLDNPIDSSFNWVFEPLSQTIQYSLNLSMGFSGINTAICLEKYTGENE